MPPAETTPAAADTPALMNPSGMCIRASRSRRPSPEQLVAVATRCDSDDSCISPTSRERQAPTCAPVRSEARGLAVVAEHADEGAHDLAFRAPGSRALDHRIDQVLVGAGRPDEV